MMENTKKPCRFFMNGAGHCSPPSGTYNYDHSIISDNEREHCYHKLKCSYKPYCIFRHPEGQGENDWQQNRRNPSRICRNVENGGTCLRSFCSFFHPSRRNSAVFHWDKPMKPPLGAAKKKEPTLPQTQRVPVIVKNFQKTKMDLQNLKMSLKEMTLD